MSRPTLKSRWLEQVTASRAIHDDVRVLLLVLARSMSDAGMVSVPQEQLAAALDRSKRRVADRVARAVTAEFLTVVARGYVGHTAVYRAMLPSQEGDTRPHPLGVERVTRRSTLSVGRTSVTLSTLKRVTDGCHPSTTDYLVGGRLIASKSSRDSRTTWAVVPHSLNGCAA